MLIVVIACIAMLAMLDNALRRGRFELIVLRHTQKFLTLRSYLQASVLDGSVRIENPLYGFLNALLRNSANTLEHRSIFGFMAFCVCHLHDFEDSHKETNRLIDELEKPQNARLKAVFDGYMKCHREFIKERHFIVIPALRYVFQKAQSRIDWLEKLKREEIEAAVQESKAVSDFDTSEECLAQ